jgi:hypothetical protein
MPDTHEIMTVVHVENNETAAHIVVGFLESHGIAATISEDDAGDQIPSLEGVLGVKVLVPSHDADRARKLLEQREAEGEQGP